MPLRQGSIRDVGLAVPLVVDGDDETDGGLADVLLYLWIEGVFLSGRMTGDEGADLHRETVDAVGLYLLQRERLLVVLLHLLVAHDIFLAAREGSEAEGYGKKERDNRNQPTRRNWGGNN